MKETAEAFLRRHDMHFAQMPFDELVRRYRADMDAALAGRPSTVFMLPSYIRDILNTYCPNAIQSAISKYTWCRRFEELEA